MDFKEYLVSKKVEDISTLDAEKQAELYNEYNEASKAEIAKAIELKASTEDVATMKAELEANITKQFVALQTVLKEQGVYMKKLSKGEAEARNESVADKLADKADALKALARGEEGARNVRFTVTKAVGDMSISGNTTGQIPQADRNPVIGDVKERATTLLDIVTIGSIGSNVKEWVYVSGEEGNAGSTAEGAIKNQIDFDLVVGSNKVEKVTAYITVTDEMLEDVEGITSLIQNKLTTKVRLSLEQFVYDGDGVSPNLEGIVTVSTAFAAGTFALAVDNPNEVDVLAVAQNQIELANCPAPTAVFMNPSDVTSLLLNKVSSTDKRYIERLQLIAGTLSFDGVPVIKSTMVPAGDFLMGDFTKANVDFKKGFTVEIGLNADNFVKNYKTIRGEVRAVCYVEHNDRTSFVTGTFSTAITALTKP